MIYIGIDPGASGGFAILQLDRPGANGAIEVLLVKMPETERDVFDLLALYQNVAGVRAVIEHVWSTPGQGGAFKFGKNVGMLLGILTAVQIPFDQVLPRTWQKRLGVIYPKGASDTEKKNITKRRAQQLFPKLTITHAIADALLMAEYCRRLERGLYGEEGKGRAQQTTEARRRKEDSKEAKPQGRGEGPATRRDPQARRRGTDAAGHGQRADQGAR